MTRAPLCSVGAPSSLLFPVSLARGLEGLTGDSGPVPASLRRSKGSLPAEVDVKGLASLLHPRSADKLLEDVVSLKAAGCSDADALAQLLRELGYHATALRSGGSHAGPGTMRLAHSFVVVKGPGFPEALVVESDFRSHFTLSSCYRTDRYKTVVEACPEVLVADYAQLKELVKLLCQEMAYSFEATGSHIPPWRQTRSVLSRWAPASA